jgi:hypothetical protein
LIPIKARVQRPLLLTLLAGRWCKRNEVAKLLHCRPAETHRRLLRLASHKCTVVRFGVGDGQLFATLQSGWKKADLFKLLGQLSD